MSKLIDTLKLAAEEMEISFSEKQLLQFNQYYQLLIEWNEKINLTSIIEPTEVAVKHFADSLTCLSALELTQGARVVDIGTGAGFPGLPLKILRPDLQVTLMDSLNKRVSFLNLIIESLKLQGITAIHDRAEDFGQNKTYREHFDVVVSRAVAKLGVLAEYCLPCVKVGGHFISQKGPDIQEEADEAKKALEVLGGRLKNIEKLQLPLLKDGRSIIVIEKIKATPKAYPRKAGTPSKKPIM